MNFNELYDSLMSEAKAKRVCAWCKKDMGKTDEDTYNTGDITHGICPECKKKLVSEINEAANMDTRNYTYYTIKNGKLGNKELLNNREELENVIAKHLAGLIYIIRHEPNKEDLHRVFRLDPSNDKYEEVSGIEKYKDQIKMDEAKKNSPKNCSECKFAERSGKYCRKNKEEVTPYDWCAAGRKKTE